MITGGQLKQIAGKQARVFLVPSLTEILRSIRSGEKKCVGYVNRLRSTELTEVMLALQVAEANIPASEIVRRRR